MATSKSLYLKSWQANTAHDQESKGLVGIFNIRRLGAKMGLDLAYTESLLAVASIYNFVFTLRLRQVEEQLTFVSCRNTCLTPF